MQIKTGQRFLSVSHLVHDKVRQHYRKQKIVLPDGWEALVAMACFPDQVEETECWVDGRTTPPARKLVGAEIEQAIKHCPSQVEKRGQEFWFLDLPKTPKKSSPLEKELAVFKSLFARDPDLTLAILTCVREYLAKETDITNISSTKVRYFFLRHTHVVKLSQGKGYRYVNPAIDNPWANSKEPTKLVAVSALNDKEVAAFLFGAGGKEKNFKAYIDLVKKARQSISFPSSKGKEPR